VLQAHVSVLTLTMTIWKQCNCTHKTWPCAAERVHSMQITPETVNDCTLLNYTVYKAGSLLLKTFAMMHGSLWILNPAFPVKCTNIFFLGVHSHQLE